MFSLRYICDSAWAALTFRSLITLFWLNDTKGISDVSLNNIQKEVSIMAKVKEKRYVSDNAQLMAEWDWEKNTELGFDPTQVAYKSNKIVCWKCYRGHEWQAKVSNRSNGKGCPYCSGQKVLVGYNDLKTTNPALASEWHYKRNGALIPENVTANSGKKVWWKCSEGHEWSAPIDSRNRGNGCPYCSGRCAVKGKNDLQTVNPNLANEWNYEKNCGLTPMDVTPNSNRKVREWISSLHSVYNTPLKVIGYLFLRTFLGNFGWQENGLPRRRYRLAMTYIKLCALIFVRAHSLL